MKQNIPVRNHADSPSEHVSALCKPTAGSGITWPGSVCQAGARGAQSSHSRQLLLLWLRWGEFQESLDRHCNLAQTFLF